ncbi:MAG: ABC transporter ATP-binding protein [Firmicutes bacterium]|jgi:peptide/nickel transport system ATP-binding protein|nr:ABC transporter ATP-binding protein [Bacillota bacterium]
MSDLSFPTDTNQQMSPNTQLGYSALSYQGDFVSAASSRGRLVLEAKNLTKVYKLGFPSKDYISAVRNANIALYEKSVVALVGESGSGKSTIASLLAGQIPKTSGEIVLNGNSVNVKSNRKFRAYKSEVQMVFQDPFASLNSIHKVRHHLKRPISIHQPHLKKSAVEKEIYSLLHQVRLLPADQFIDKFPYELSGGQRQRVAIARSLAARPKVLLADEPVSMLDVSIRLEVLSLIDDLRDRFNLAVLYVTHDIASARYFADETVVIYGGDIVERGPSEDVTQNPAHPYTQLLVSAAPNPDDLGGSIRNAKLTAGTTKPRQTESALTSGIGCRFTPRCPFADRKCEEQFPPLVTISENRQVACWHIEQSLPNVSFKKISPKSQSTAEITLQGAHSAFGSEHTGSNHISHNVSDQFDTDGHSKTSQPAVPERDSEDGTVA